MAVREERLNGAVTIERVDNFIRLFWTDDVHKNQRKTFKQALLKEFAGKLIIDFRRKGASLIMNDMVVVLSEDINLDSFRKELIASFQRTRSGDLTISESTVVFSDPDKLSGKITVNFYDKQRKVMAQGEPGPLKHFIAIYGNAINNIAKYTVIPTKNVNVAGQEIPVDDEVFLNSQEQSEPDELADEIELSETSLCDETLPEATDIIDPHLLRIDPSIAHANDPLSVTTFIKFSQSFLSEMRDVKENVKAIMTQLPDIAQMSVRMETMEANYKTDIAYLKGQLLIQEEETRNLKADLNKVREGLRQNKASVNSIAVDIGRVSDDLSSAKLKATAPPPVATELMQLSDDFAAFQRSLSAYQDKTGETIALMQEAIADYTKQPAIQSPTTETSSHQPEWAIDTPAVMDSINPPGNSNTNGRVFNCNVIIFIDSNGGHIRPEILKHNCSVEKVWSPTFGHALEIMKGAQFVTKPEKILFHCGTNDVETLSPAEITKRISAILEVTRSLLPDVEIFVSEIMARLDLQDEVWLVNDSLYPLATRYNGVTIIRHGLNISEDMLTDKKHLDKKGFFIMLANFRFYMFGIIKLRSRSRYRSRRY